MRRINFQIKKSKNEPESLCWKPIQEVVKVLNRTLVMTKIYKKLFDKIIHEHKKRSKSETYCVLLIIDYSY